MAGCCLLTKRVFRSTRVLVCRSYLYQTNEGRGGEGRGRRSTLFLSIKLHFSSSGLWLKIKVVSGHYQALI